MASMKVFTIIAIVALVVVPPALAKEFVVGDDQGWSMGFNYHAWAEANEFRVGDQLIFKYVDGAHNVLSVNETAVQQCVVPTSSQPLESGHDVITLTAPGQQWYICGHDVITLTAPGQQWYICGVGRHCELGNQKLVIKVLPQLVEISASSTSPNIVALPPSTATDINASKSYVITFAAFAFFIMIML